MNTNTFAGVVSLMWAACVVNALGFILCLTGIGAIIGLPSMLVGFAVLFGAPLLGLYSRWKSKQPPPLPKK